MRDGRALANDLLRVILSVGWQDTLCRVQLFALAGSGQHISSTHTAPDDAICRCALLHELSRSKMALCPCRTGYGRSDHRRSLHRPRRGDRGDRRHQILLGARPCRPGRRTSTTRLASTLPAADGLTPPGSRGPCGHAKFGIDRLLAERRRLCDGRCEGKRVALLAHPASVTADLTHSLDALVAAGLMSRRCSGRSMACGATSRTI